MYYLSIYVSNLPTIHLPRTYNLQGAFGNIGTVEFIDLTMDTIATECSITFAYSLAWALLGFDHKRISCWAAVFMKGTCRRQMCYFDMNRMDVLMIRDNTVTRLTYVTEMIA